MSSKRAYVVVLILLALTLWSTPARCEGMPTLDPLTYTAGQFLQDAETKTNSDRLGLAILWGYGYMCGKDQSFVQPITEKLITDITVKYMLVCREHPEMNLMQATQAVMRLSEAMKKPAGN